MIKPNLISGKKKSSIKETYNRTTNGGFSKAEDPQGTPHPADEMKEFTPKPFNAKYQFINCGINVASKRVLDTHISEEHVMRKTNVESHTSGKFRRYETHPDRISKTPFNLKFEIVSKHEQNSLVHEELKPCEHKASWPLKLVGSVHEGKKTFQCEECEMLIEEKMENAGEALASESDLQVHKSLKHEEKKAKKRYI